MENIRNKIITISGEPASGKSTVVKEIKSKYEKQGFNIIEVLTSKNMKLTFDNSIKQSAQHIDAQYKVTQDNELCVFKSIQSMK